MSGDHKGTERQFERARGASGRYTDMCTGGARKRVWERILEILGKTHFRVRCSHSSASSMDGFEEAKERIRETFRKVELTPSCYDTAWVAMVPSRHSLKQPCLGFIEMHGWAIDNKDQISPLGFEIIFPSMIKSAEKLNLNLPLDSTIKRTLRNNFTWSTIGNLEYMAEGFGELCKWKEIMLHQRQNGSLFDSPATTAAALIYHQHDEHCFEYLNSILKLHKNWVPTMYPMKMHSLLSLDEEIFSNVANCAMAFRLLRMSNYEVSSEEIAEFADEEHFFARSGKFTSDVGIIELHKASQLAIHEKDHILDKINNWTAIFMQKKLLNNDFLDINSKKEVELALRKFYITYDRVENRRYIESCEENNFKMLKAAYRWFEDCRLGDIGFSEQYIYTSSLIGVSVIFEPEFSDARLIYAKYVILLTLADDLFDGFSSKDELLNIIELVERWDEYTSVGYHSERNEVIFLAIYNTVEELAAKAEIYQGRSVKDQLINLWLDGLKCMLIEVDWWTSKRTPSTEEYLSATCITFGTVCIVLTAQYFLGIKLPKSLIEGAEMNGLCECTGIVCRLLNDLITYKREGGERTMNLIVTLMAQSHGTITEQEAVRQIKEIVESNRRQSLGMVLQSNNKGSSLLLPQVCKDLFLKTTKAVYFFYSDHDEFRSPKQVKNHINQVIYKPIYQSFSNAPFDRNY
ncbi:synthase [Datura stramonium]|uniref:Synthase n=1 Tax=Datura stramonium TaxID=4076 RepID=A0ABS8UMU9_DATST|nr:synthase [Datura stramonium]